MGRDKQELAMCADSSFTAGALAPDAAAACDRDVAALPHLSLCRDRWEWTLGIFVPAA